MSTSATTGPAPSGRQFADGPLQGLRVLELGALLAGPFAGRLLADLGAEVIKIEAPDRPDPMRDWGQASYRGHYLWWPVISRNKRCVTLNLRTEVGQQMFLDLVAGSDAIVENFRPGTLERWNLGYERLSERNPSIVLARVSGYGQTGPYRDRAGYAAAAEAMGGLRYINGHPGQEPPRAGISLGDSLAGMFACQGLLAALYQRDALGRRQGQVIDVSIVESCFALMESAAPEFDRLGYVRGPSGSRLPGITPSNAFRSADDKMVVIAANQDTVFRRLAVAIGRPELADDPRFAGHRERFAHQTELEEMIAAWAGSRDAAEIDAVLNEAGVVSGPIYSIADIFSDAHMRERGMLVEHDDPELGPYIGPGVVPKFTETPGRVRWTGRWALGADNAGVFGDLLGLKSDDLARLHQDRVI